MNKLGLDPGVVAACRDAAAEIPATVITETAGRTTTSIERTVARLLGVNGGDSTGVPLFNVLIDHVRSFGGMGKGSAYWLGNAMIPTGTSPMEIARAVATGRLSLGEQPLAADPAIRSTVRAACERALLRIKDSRLGRREKRQDLLERAGRCCMSSLRRATSTTISIAP